MHPAYNYIKQAINGQYPDTEASAIAKAILTDVFQLSTTDLYASKDMNFSTNQAEKLEVIITRLRENEPLQYILGNCYFCGLNFHRTTAGRGRVQIVLYLVPSRLRWHPCLYVPLRLYKGDY